ncbi:MAG: valine--tRNA ligase [Phycisphaerae bacterium]|nr:valine--tRNA ligase [Phycisphaerae bacterium]
MPDPNPNPPPIELAKAYAPAEHEARIRARWEASGAFHAEPARVLSGERKPYCIVIPPPNVTDRLHLGHALNNTLQDVLARYRRMQDFEVLWMPGTDHAGIATQAVVERRLRKDGTLRGPLRESMPRDTFVTHVQAFKDEYEATITDQLKAMGCSCDWQRQRFTMDEICARAVQEAFFRLFKDGLIYRGKRLVNWDPLLQTAVADDECFDEEVDSFFYYLRYPLVRSDAPDAPPVVWADLARDGYPGANACTPSEQAWVTVATTRPETYLADTAVAVNPHDPRAAALRGLWVRLPFLDRVIPVIEDSYVVLPKTLARSEEEAADPKADFATGFLKVTPGHDANDWELGVRHRLAVVNMMSPDGRVSDAHAWDGRPIPSAWLGRKMEEARKLVVKAFESDGRMEPPRPYRHSLKFSDRSKSVIEPYLSDQWYVRVTDRRFASAANQAIASGALRIHPDRYAKTYQQWHDNIRDWCISRQLWWGHRVPVWRGPAGTAFGTTPPDRPAPDDASPSVVTARVGGAVFAIQNRIENGTRYQYVSTASGDAEIHAWLERQGYVRDPDVLDTWFSSALWPMSTMGWPDDTDLLRAFNPTSTLCTAREILTLWVSRMVMFNRYFMGAGQGGGPAPFRDVFIHAVIQDGEGRKMSKSLGNGVDPLDIIATHGSDAMRFVLCQMSTNTQDVRMPVVKDPKSGRNSSPKFDLGRNFANKLWNASRFAIEKLAASPAASSGSAGSRPLLDRWLESRVAETVSRVNAALESFEYSVYAQAMYDLVWRDFCDWYLEGVKPTIAGDPAQRATLLGALRTIVKLLHPAMPYVTEAIWERLRTLDGFGSDSELLCTASWPVPGSGCRDEVAEQEFERLRAVVTAVREVRAAHNVPPKRRVIIHAGGDALAFLAAHTALVESLAGSEPVRAALPGSGDGRPAEIRFEGRAIFITGLADGADASADRIRLERLIAELDKGVAALAARLGNPGYTDRAPAHLVEETRAQLAAKQRELAESRLALERLA